MNNTGMNTKRLTMSLSFAIGHGNIEHNLRITKGKGVRQNGVKERRFINEYSCDTSSLPKCYTKDLVYNTIYEEIKLPLAKYNEKQIATGHTERVKTPEQWIESQCYNRNGETRKVVQEVVVQVGDKFTGCPYEVQTNSNGYMLDKNGLIIKGWDTRKVPMYKNNTITESKISKKLKRVYKQFVKEFEKKNPQMKILCWGIHGDEGGGLHLHINYIFFSKTKNGIGIGLSKTSAMKQQYESMGIKCENDRTNNAQNRWRADMRLLLETICNKNSIDRLDKQNKEKHRTTKQFYAFKDKYCEDMERREKLLNAKRDYINACDESLKEALDENNHRMIQMEWYKLKTKYPDVYKDIHAEYEKDKKMLHKGLDRKANVLYNSK